MFAFRLTDAERNAAQAMASATRGESAAAAMGAQFAPRPQLPPKPPLAPKPAKQQLWPAAQRRQSSGASMHRSGGGGSSGDPSGAWPLNPLFWLSQRDASVTGGEPQQRRRASSLSRLYSWVVGSRGEAVTQFAAAAAVERQLDVV
jgi:hypothetical protein